MPMCMVQPVCVCIFSASVRMFRLEDWSHFENCAFLRYYEASSGNSLPTFRDNLLVPSSRVKNTRIFLDSWLLKMGPIDCPETSARNYHYSPRSSPEECSSQPLRGGSLKLCLVAFWHCMTYSQCHYRLTEINISVCLQSMLRWRAYKFMRWQMY